MSTSARWARRTLLSLTFSTLILSSSVIGVLSLFLLPNLAESQASGSLLPSFFEVSDEESYALLPTAGGTPTWNENTDTCTIPVGSTLNATTPDSALSIATGVTLKNEGTINNGGGSGNDPLPIDVVFSIDSSGSMTSNDPNNLRLSGAIEFVNKLTPGVDQAAVVSWDGDDDDDCTYPNPVVCPAGFGTDADWFQSLTFNLNQVKHGTTANPVDSGKSVCNIPVSPPQQPPQTTCGIDDVDNISASGTNLEAGLYKAIEVMDANTRVEPSNKIIVFLTDGKVEGGYDYQRSFEGGPAVDARARGYTVYAIGLGTSLDLGILGDMANATNGGLYISPTATNLDAIYADIYEKSSANGVEDNIFRIYNNGTLVNNGVINASWIENRMGAVLNNSVNGSLLMKGPVVNRGIINNNGLWLNDGAIYNSAVIHQFCGASITGMGMIVGNSPVNACFPIGTIAEATTDSTGQSINAGVRTFYGQKFGTGAAVISSVVDCATVKIRKFGSPTGMAEIGFYDANMNLVKSFGTKDVATLTTSYTSYEFCLPSADSGHLIQNGQILAVKYTGGDSLNRIEVRRSNIGSGPDYDGLASYNVNFDISWHIYNTAGNSRDLLFKLTNS